MTSGKNKGNAFERHICKKLTHWLTGQDDPIVFWRSASSGAIATIARKKKRETVSMDGDIVGLTVDALFITDRLYLECKSYRNWEIDSLLRGNKRNIVYKWLEKLMEESRVSNKIPWLIFKRNGSPEYVIFPDSFVVELVNYFNLNLPAIRFRQVCGNLNFSMYIFDDVLAHCEATGMKELLRCSVCLPK